MYVWCDYISILLRTLSDPVHWAHTSHSMTLVSLHFSCEVGRALKRIILQCPLFDQQTAGEIIVADLHKILFDSAGVPRGNDKIGSAFSSTTKFQGIIPNAHDIEHTIDNLDSTNQDTFQPVSDTAYVFSELSSTLPKFHQRNLSATPGTMWQSWYSMVIYRLIVYIAPWIF